MLILQEPHYWPRDTKVEKGLRNLLQTQMWNAIIATKRAICPKTVGQKEEERKGKDQKGGKDQTMGTDQTRHKKPMQT